MFDPDDIRVSSEKFAEAVIQLGFHGDPSLLQSWVSERRDGDIVLRPWSLCVLDTWAQDCFKPADHKVNLADTQSQPTTASILNARETNFLRSYILDELDVDASRVVENIGAR